MNPHSRLRKTIKWGGLAASVVMAGVWIASARWGTAVIDRYCNVISVEAGVVMLQHTFPGGPDLARAQAQFGRRTVTYFSWWFHWEVTARYRVLFIPVWALAAAALLPSAAAWRLDALARRRNQSGHCPNCRYDRRGLAADAVCPECGAIAPVTPTKPPNAPR